MADEDLDYIPGSAIPGFVLPIMTSGVALAVGALFGGIVIWFLKAPEIVEKLVARDLSQQELEEVCAPLVLEKANELQEAHDKVMSLQGRISEKQARVAALEQEMKTRDARGKAAAKEWRAMKKELEDLKVRLDFAEEEKKQLIVKLEATVKELERTEVALVKQKVKTKLAKEDALTNKWHRFLNKSQLEICDRGGRKKLGKCRETVSANLATAKNRDAFSHCVRAGQESPSVHLLAKKSKIPEFAAFLNQDNRVTKDWYLQSCDPTLPESDGFIREEHLPGGKVSWEDLDDDGDFGDIPEDDKLEIIDD